MSHRPLTNTSSLKITAAQCVPKGIGPDTTLAWPGWKQPDIPVEVDTDGLETSRTEAGI